MAATAASLLLITLLSLTPFSQARDLIVGGKAGAWKVPSSQADSLNKWAEATRFQIGDTLVWSYNGKKDSVLEVTRAAYSTCNVTSPIAEYMDGDTRVELTRAGAHYFISGVSGNCQKGQKLIVVVMAPRSVLISPAASPVEAPAVAPTSGGVGLSRGVLLGLWALIGFVVMI